MAKEVAAILGTDFFRSLVTYLASTLHLDCAYVAELGQPPNDRMHTLAVCQNGQLAENFVQGLAGSSSGQVITDGVVAWSSDAAMIFPLDSFLERMQAVGYVGIRLLDPSGGVLGLMGVASRKRLTDIKLVKSVLEAFAPRAAAELERKRADDLLRQSEERYRAFVTQNSDAMWRIEFEKPVPTDLDENEQIRMIHEHGYLAECNGALCAMLGASTSEELIGLRFAQLFPRMGGWATEEVRSVVRSGYRFSTMETAPLQGKHGTVYRLRTQLGIVENNQLLRLWGMTRDITELRRAERSLEASEQRFRDVLDSVELLAVTLDSQGRVTFCNRYLLRLLQLPEERLIGSSWSNLIESPGERDCWAALLAPPAGGKPAPVHFEGAVVTTGGSRRLIAWDIASHRDDSGNIAGLAGIGKDVTDQRALEVQLRQAQKLDSLSRVAGGIAHDFNNLLTIVVGQTAFLQSQLEASNPMIPSLTAIQEAGTRCAELTQQLLAVGGRQRLRPELVNLNSLIANEETILRSLVGERVSVATRFDPSLGDVYADPVQLRRVFANFAVNACEAMPDGGSLVITTANIEIRESEPNDFAGVPPGRYVTFAFSDSGVGITDELRDRIFDPFFTTKPAGQGSGLGLATVYGIVAQSGGHISVRTKPGAGTTFYVLLPRM